MIYRLVFAVNAAVLSLFLATCLGCYEQANGIASLASAEGLEFRFTETKPEDKTNPLPLFEGSGNIGVFPEVIVDGQHVAKIEIQHKCDEPRPRSYLIFHFDQVGIQKLRSAVANSPGQRLGIIFNSSVITAVEIPEYLPSQLVVETDTGYARRVFQALTAG